MIFRQVKEIETGQKNQARRICKPHEDFLEGFAMPGKYVKHNGRLKWAVGRIYSIVPKRGLRGVGRIRLTDIRLENLQQITEDDARAEGVADVAAYRVLWESINGIGSWEKNPRIWVLTFEYIYTGES